MFDRDVIAVVGAAPAGEQPVDILRDDGRHLRVADLLVDVHERVGHDILGHGERVLVHLPQLLVVPDRVAKLRVADAGVVAGLGHGHEAPARHRPAFEQGDDMQDIFAYS